MRKLIPINQVQHRDLVNLKSGLVIIQDKKVFDELLKWFSENRKNDLFYSPQPAWIQKNASVLENVTISSTEPFDLLIYEKSLKISKLEGEISDQDLTLNLSQGQKQRLILARAFYSRKSILLLEEPLSGLDRKNRDLIIEGFFKALSDKFLFVIYSKDKSILDWELEREIPLNPISPIQSEESHFKPEMVESREGTWAENNGVSDTFKFVGLLSGAIVIIISQQFFKTLFYKASQTSLTFSHSSIPQLVLWAELHFITFFLGSWLVFRAFSSLGQKFFSKINSLLMNPPYTRLIRTVCEDLKNSLSIDLYEAEYKLPEVVRSFLVLLVSTLATAGLMIYAMPILLIPCSLLIIMLGVLSFYFRRPLLVSNELVARSNTRLLGLINDYQTGHSAIYFNPSVLANMNSQLERELLFLNSSSFFNYSLPGWLEVRLSFIGVSVISLLSITGLLFGGNSVLFGIAMAKSITLTKNLHSIIRKASELEEYRVHINRLRTFSSAGKEVETKETVKLIEESSCEGLIEFRDLTLKYGNVIGFSKSIPFGSKVLIQGPSGCGKSTILLAMLEPNLIKFGKVNISPKRKMLYATSNPIIFDGLSIGQHFNPSPKNSISFYLRKFGIEDDSIMGADLLPEQKIIVAFLRIHFEHTKEHIILLDEITSGLRSSFRDLVEEIILTEWNEATVFYISHTTGNSSRFSHHWLI